MRNREQLLKATMLRAQTLRKTLLVIADSIGRGPALDLRAAQLVGSAEELTKRIETLVSEAMAVPC